MSRLRADALIAASIPLLLLAGLLSWQVNEMCTMSGCGAVSATAWNGSPAWALPTLAGIALAGWWVLRLPSGPVPAWFAGLTAAVAAVGVLVLGASLDALVFGRSGVFPYDLPVGEEFPVLSVRPGPGLFLGLLGLLVQVVAGWMAVRAEPVPAGPRAARRGSAGSRRGPGTVPSRPATAPGSPVAWPHPDALAALPTGWPRGAPTDPAARPPSGPPTGLPRQIHWPEAGRPGDPPSDFQRHR